jgi:hypothetical protein
MKLSQKELALILADLDMMMEGLEEESEFYTMRKNLCIKISKELAFRGYETLISKTYNKVAKNDI